jgi:hypothetical protein
LVITLTAQAFQTNVLSSSAYIVSPQTDEKQTHISPKFPFSQSKNDGVLSLRSRKVRYPKVDMSALPTI